MYAIRSYYVRTDYRCLGRRTVFVPDPAQRAERLRDVGEELHEQDERREEGVEGDAGKQQSYNFV